MQVLTHFSINVLFQNSIGGQLVVSVPVDRARLSLDRARLAFNRAR